MLPAFSQHILEDELLQARVHYMNAPKVSYVTSADIHQDTNKAIQEPDIPSDIRRSFEERYQDAKSIAWVIKEDRYKVNFIFMIKDLCSLSSFLRPLASVLCLLFSVLCLPRRSSQSEDGSSALTQQVLSGGMVAAVDFCMTIQTSAVKSPVV